MSLASNSSGFNGRIRRALAIADHDNPFGGQLITRLEGRHMYNLPLEQIASLEEGDVGRLRVEADAYDSEIKFLGPLLRAVAIGDPPPHPGAGLLLQTEDRVAESDVRQHFEVARIIGEILLKDGPWRKIRGALGQ